MTILSKATTERIIKMSNLELSDSFLEQSADSLTNITNWLEELQQVDTSTVEPMFAVADFLNQQITTWRQDIVTATESLDEVLLNTADKEDVFIAVPKVIE